jgi:hypothetical protein
MFRSQGVTRPVFRSRVSNKLTKDGRNYCLHRETTRCIATSQRTDAVSPSLSSTRFGDHLTAAVPTRLILMLL